jgi:hypothetical protein
VRMNCVKGFLSVEVMNEIRGIRKVTVRERVKDFVVDTQKRSEINRRSRGKNFRPRWASDGSQIHTPPFSSPQG